jgi:hypothetical protein
LLKSSICSNLNRFSSFRFTYLTDAKNLRAQTLVLGLKSSFRWCLSGTPKHENFNDIQTLATLLGVHLGVDEPLPGTKLKKTPAAGKERTGLESLSLYMDLKSMQWHERRHSLAQTFLDRFVRQNVAEIDEIPYEETEICIDLPPAERAIYLELETHLESLEMNNKQALKSKKKSKGDRESRMQKVLQESESAEEALLKCSSHFNMSSESATALETVDDIIKLRVSQQSALEKELVRGLVAAFRQRKRILAGQPDWGTLEKQEKLEISDPVAQYIQEVETNKSVTHGADEEIHLRVLHLVKNAAKLYEADPDKIDAIFAEATKKDEKEEADAASKKRKRPSAKSKKSDDDDESRYYKKLALRNHMHIERSLGKELCGRIRSLRYIQRIRSFQDDASEYECSRCKVKGISVDKVAVLSSCGHFGCLDCMKSCATNGECVDINCQARVSAAHVVSSTDLGLDQDDSGGGKYGLKLATIVEKVKEVTRTKNGDRAIVFCQFDDLTKKVATALEESGVKTKTLGNDVRSQVKTVSLFQKEHPAKDDPRVLLLKMDDERSAGLNLTGLNHAFFGTFRLQIIIVILLSIPFSHLFAIVHPLLAGSNQEYVAYETQAIGRIRRYGQKKKVHVWRFLANNTIDTRIFEERTGRKPGDVNQATSSS